ncbi:hypothetical protein RMATCC62417_13375 [Rhizopus microsporus]|nr:hypothetical protein RMATCC62417_13375 [Rhizopus microsporus]
MKRKKDDDPPPPKAKRNKGKAVDRGLPSLFSQTQTNLFKNTAFEANDDEFQETLLLRKDKNICTTLKAVKENASAPDPSNVVINEKTPMPTVNKDTSVHDVLPAPIPSIGCTSAPIKTRLIRLTHLKRKKKRARQQPMSKNKYDVLLVV